LDRASKPRTIQSLGRGNGPGASSEISGRVQTLQESEGRVTQVERFRATVVPNECERRPTSGGSLARIATLGQSKEKRGELSREEKLTDLTVIAAKKQLFIVWSVWELLEQSLET